ncbi:hypothetical protein C4D60_Mb01t23380 [Musa balbisiana]|uniref:Uncharacterized protein n=1 Tax=Musa balbisiana TaxID=52838 RepID=A0A4S8JP95_MUSBA|nr:hypothetical protein C4D60_Mb01t23380 [Musa balbisiana]
MMIKGYVANGRYSDAPEFVFRCALDDPVDMIAMDSSVLVSILTVSAHLGLHRVGKQVHGHIVALGTVFLTGKQIHAQAPRTGIQDGHNSVVIETALVDMFSKWEEVYKFVEEWRKQGVGGEPGPSQIQVAAGTLDRVEPASRVDHRSTSLKEAESPKAQS